MYRKPILAAFCVLLLGPVWSASAGFDPNLVAWWPFDEGSGTIAGDWSGNGYDGTIGGGTQWVAGMLNGALQFNGSDAEVVAPHIAFDNRSFAIALWVNLGQNSAEHIAFSQRQSDSTGLNLHLRLGGTGNPAAGGINFGFYSNDLVTGGDLLALNTWYHLTFTYDYANQDRRIYVDGVQVAQATATPYLGTTGNTVIGSWDTGQFFTGMIDDVQVYHKALSDAEIAKIMKGLADTSIASDPIPDDATTDVPRDVVLGWTPGEFAATHDVYFGTSFDDVNDATEPLQSVTDAAYDPEGLLEYGQTYYWRIDEVNDAPDDTTFKGEVWSFTSEQYAYPITNVTATASAQQPASPASKTVDGSGLDEFDQHGVDLKTMWSTAGGLPASIQYAFDKVYKLHELWVWNANSELESLMGFGAKDVAIEYSTDGETWTALENVPEFAQGTGLTTYTANTIVDLGEVLAQHVRLTVNDNWGEMSTIVSLSEVRFFYTPTQAFEPDPADDATGVGINATLNWRPGREAISHEVHFGADPNALTAETVTDHSYTPAPMDLDTAYYWKVNEVGDAGTYEGDVWTFTTQEFLVVDDFESYTDDMDAEEAVFQTWSDGYEDDTNGSIVGIEPAVNGTFCETTIVHGDRQSMPFFYNNSGQAAYAEAKWTFDDAQDWTASGIKSLSLYFAGVAGNTGQLYVKINNTKVVYDGDTTDLTQTIWHPWNIDLSTVANVNSVRSLALGVDGSGAAGTLYFDDIRLYARTPEFVTPADPGSEGLVAHYGLDNNADDSSGNGNNGTAEGNPDWTQGMVGDAMQFNGASARVVAPHIPLDNRSFTVALWINPVLFTAEQVVFSQTQASATDTDMHFRLGGPGAASGNVPAGGVRMAFYGNDLDTAGGLIQDNNWYHITFCYDFENQERSIYVDGVLAAQASATPYLGNSGDTIIGAWGTSQWFQGIIDEVQIYHRAMSAEEAAWLAGRRVPLHKPM